MDGGKLKREGEKRIRHHGCRRSCASSFAVDNLLLYGKRTSATKAAGRTAAAAASYVRERERERYMADF